MLETRAICALSLLSVAACDGPTLNAGSYLEPDAGAAEDARVDEGDAADEQPGNVEEDAGRGRDGGRYDFGGRYPVEERHRCNNTDQCDEQIFNRVCNGSASMCVECTNDQHCERFGPRFRCDEMAGFCWDRDQRPRP
jgi:hypothetical protein